MIMIVLQKIIIDNFRKYKQAKNFIFFKNLVPSFYFKHLEGPFLRKNIFWRRRLTCRMKETYLQHPRNSFSSAMKSRNMRTRIRANARRISNICSRTCERLRENFVRFISSRAKRHTLFIHSNVGSLIST